MSQSSFRYLHLDVFTDRLFGGNQLAVFPDGRGLEPGTMQAIAAEMAFSETTFVFPPEDPATDVRVRIFTPAAEMPMAGHPTIGTTFALAREGVIRPGQAFTTFGLGVGPTRVDLAWQADRLTFAWMTQRPPIFGRVVDDRAAVAATLGLAASDFQPGVPVEEVSCGVPFLFLPLASRAAVDVALLDRAALARVYRRLGIEGELPLFLFTTEPGADGATVYSRMFAPGLGVAEDPATGAASGPLGCYLVQHGLVPAAEAGRIVSQQGVKMGRPSRIHIEITAEGDTITRVRIGGEAVFVGEGRIWIERKDR